MEAIGQRYSNQIKWGIYFSSFKHFIHLPKWMNAKTAWQNLGTQDKNLILRPVIKVFPFVGKMFFWNHDIKRLRWWAMTHGLNSYRSYFAGQMYRTQSCLELLTYSSYSIVKVAEPLDDLQSYYQVLSDFFKDLNWHKNSS